MNISTRKIMDKFRRYRTQKFKPVGKFFYNIGLNANLMTLISLLSGLTAVYFLFDNYLYFFILAVTHLITDGLDGVIARASKPTKFGDYFDHISDNTIAILLIVKIGWYLNDYYAYIVAMLFILAVIIYFTSRCKAPIFFMRSVGIGILTIVTHPAMPYTDVLLTASYLFAGAVTVYSLSKQLQWFLSRKQ